MRGLALRGLNYNPTDSIFKIVSLDCLSVYWNTNQKPSSFYGGQKSWKVSTVYSSRFLNQIILHCDCYHDCLKVVEMLDNVVQQWSRDGVLVRAPMWPGVRFPDSALSYGSSLLLVLFSASRVVSPGTPIFPSPKKNQHFEIPIRSGMLPRWYMSIRRGRLGNHFSR